MTETTTPFTAVILAGKRPGEDPVAEAAGVACKSFAPIDGRPMVLRVLDALAGTRQVGSQIMCGPSPSIITHEPELQARIQTGQIKWMDCLSTPSASTYSVLQSLRQNIPVLVTTADHALLTSQIVDFFCDQARRSGCDLAVGLTSYKGVREAFPETRRTPIKFNDDAYCGCNLFGFLNQQSHRAAAFWRQIEQERKKPLHMMRVLGWWTVLQYISGRFSLAQGLEKLSAKIHIRVRAVLLPFPQAAVDVDTVDDWHFVQQLAQRQSL
jgi:GTP:adenosylcobinamide-phosphate guanylyltransferase